MKKNKNSNFKLKVFSARRGYTFVETIVILSILLILVSAAITAFMDMRKKSRDVSEKAVIAALQTAINQYHARYLVWPQQNPFTRMVSPPTYNNGNYSDCKEIWGSVSNIGCGCTGGSGGDWGIYCPHYNPTEYCNSTGSIWCYCYDGTFAGKVKLISSMGH